ncbi:MAG TPA: hypothetical protein VF469_07775, partial [Kofleriaceae bacterium]
MCDGTGSIHITGATDAAGKKLKAERRWTAACIWGTAACIWGTAACIWGTAACTWGIAASCKPRQPRKIARG